MLITKKNSNSKVYEVLNADYFRNLETDSEYQLRFK